MTVEEFFESRGIDTCDIVCYSTPDGTNPPIDFDPIEFAQLYHESQLKAKMPSDAEIELKAFEAKTANDVSRAFLLAKRKFFIKGAKWLKQQILKP